MAEIITLDDVQDAVVLIRKILSRRGHTVQTFTEEEDAIRYAQKNHIDLAILDIKLKKMSGIEVLAELKRIQPEMKAIILTGYPTVETARDALSFGANEYCVKPIDKQELENKVEKVLQL
jgi:DNA-binding NtrC family response regulator